MQLVGADIKSSIWDTVSLRYPGWGDVKEAVGYESGAGRRYRWDTNVDVISVWL